MIPHRQDACATFNHHPNSDASSQLRSLALLVAKVEQASCLLKRNWNPACLQ